MRAAGKAADEFNEEYGKMAAQFVADINPLYNLGKLFECQGSGSQNAGYILGMVPGFKLGGNTLSVMNNLSKRFPGFVPLVSRIGGSANKSEIYLSLQKIAKGDWIKVYQGGHVNGKATEIHFFLHKESGLIANPKIKFSRQIETILKELGY